MGRNIVFKVTSHAQYSLRLVERPQLGLLLLNLPLPELLDFLPTQLLLAELGFERLAIVVLSCFLQVEVGVELPARLGLVGMTLWANLWRLEVTVLAIERTENLVGVERGFGRASRRRLGLRHGLLGWWAERVLDVVCLRVPAAHLLAFVALVLVRLRVVFLVVIWVALVGPRLA